jgi:hypothetical protein
MLAATSSRPPAGAGPRRLPPWPMALPTKRDAIARYRPARSPKW